MDLFSDQYPTIPVLLPLPFDQPFDYRIGVDQQQALRPGSFVLVPFGPRRLVGVVWPEEGGNKVAPERLKDVIAVLDVPPLPPAILRQISWTARETLAMLGSVLRLAMSVPAALEPAPGETYLKLGGVAPEKLTAKRRSVLEALQSGGALRAAALCEKSGASKAVVKAMLDAGFIEAEERVAVSQPQIIPKLERKDAPLTEQQVDAAGELCRLVAAGSAKTVLLDGVPGSGKTEVYFEAMAAAIKAGRRALVLLPEIALTAQWLQRFERRFGAKPALWHSGLTAAQRRDLWRSIAKGEIPIVAGARSALFLPLDDAGVIVIDEEHDQGFKQDDGVSYDSRKVAAARAEFEHAVLIKASATPSIESLVRVEDGLDLCLRLPDSHGEANPPRIELNDLRKDRPPGGMFLSPTVREALANNLAKGEQSLLFLNRRGYAPLTLCRACGHRYRCPNCSAWMVTHRFRGRLMCHHCAYSMPAPEHCVECGSVDSLVATGPGAERIAEEVGHLFPNARVVVMTSDTVSTARKAEVLITAMTNGEIDILVGTQLIAKGHHFPGLTLVVAIDADLGLSGGDLRAAERSFQLLYQVAGRAGREALPGRVLVQTHQPDHPVMQALAHNDRDAFVEAEICEREEARMPPFGRLAALIVSGTDARLVRSEAQSMARSAPFDDEVLVLGPAPAPLAMLRGRYRERLLVKASLEVDLPLWLRRWLGQVKIDRKVQVRIDVDPQSFL